MSIVNALLVIENVLSLQGNNQFNGGMKVNEKI
jgi:hypothetical protein